MGAALSSLIRSRKVLLSIWAFAQTIILHYWLNADFEIIAALDGLVVVLIGAIAHEDAAMKSAGKQ